MWSHYDANYHQKAEATLNKTGQLLTPHFSASASQEEPERHWAVSTAAPSNMIQQNARARKASAQPAKTSKAFIRNNRNKGRMYASTGTTTALVTPHHAATNMNASSASQKRTLSWIVPRGLKGTPSRRRTQLSKKQTITYHSYS